MDATGAVEDVSSECEKRREKRIYFGFPDALLKERMIYADLLPSCAQGLTPVVHISSAGAQELADQIKAAFQQNDNQYAAVLLEQGEWDDQTIDELVRELKFGLYYVYYKTAEGKMVYHLFAND